MSRTPKEKSFRSITIQVDQEMALALDQYQAHFGLESRSGTVFVLLETAMGALPIQSAEMELLEQTKREFQKYMFRSMAEFFEGQARLLKAP